MVKGEDLLYQKPSVVYLPSSSLLSHCLPDFPLINSVTLDKLFNFSMPQFSLLLEEYLECAQ